MASRKLDTIKEFVECSYIQIEAMWRRAFGENEDAIEPRFKTLYSHVKQMMLEMVDDESECIAELESVINERKMEILKLQEELDELAIGFIDENLPLAEQRKLVTEALVVLQEKKAARLRDLDDIRKQERLLLDALGSTDPYLKDVVLPNDEQLQDMKDNVVNLRNEVVKRQNMYRTKKATIQRLIQELELPLSVEERSILNHDERISVTDTNISKLEGLEKSLLVRKEENEREEKKLMDQLIKLWDYVNVRTENRKMFLENHTGISKAALERLSAEIARCREIRLCMMKEYIPKLQEELSRLWDQCVISNCERQTCKAYYSDDLTEEVANALEEEILKYNEYYEENRELLHAVEHRQKLIDELYGLQNKVHDVDRLKNRGGALLREEKRKKQLLKVEIPKAEKTLIELITQFEKKYDKTFVYQGEALLTTLNQRNTPAGSKTPRTPGTQSKRATRIMKCGKENALPSTNSKSKEVGAHRSIETVPARSKTVIIAGSKTPMGIRNNVGSTSTYDVRTLWKETPKYPKKFT